MQCHGRFIFSSPELKAQVSFSDRLSSVVCPSVCKLFLFSTSSPEPLGQFQPNLAQSILGCIHLNKLESHLPMDVLYQVWLKLAQWFWRRSCKCEKFTTTKTTDNRQIFIRGAHLSFQLR